MVKTLEEVIMLKAYMFSKKSFLYSDADILMQEILGITKQDILIHRDKTFDEQSFKILEKAFCQLYDGRPLQYIIGNWEFMGERFKVGEGVLIPREDTTAVIELALGFLNGKQNACFADLGSGSGCIAGVISKRLDIEGVAVEKSDKAFTFLNYNLKKLGVRVTPILGDMFSKEVKDEIGKVDLIVSNPPYINAEDMQKLDENVKREPNEALFGGDDGLYFYREIVSQYKDHIKDGGAICFEVGYDQADAVTKILLQNGFKNITENRDINNIRRAIGATK